MENLQENNNNQAENNTNSAGEIWRAAGFTDDQIAVLKADAAKRVEEQKKEQERKARETEFESNLEIILKDPLLAGQQEEFSKFARESSLRNFGKEGLIETMKLFNKQLEAGKGSEAKPNVSQGIDNPGDSKSASATQFQNGIPTIEGDSNIIDFTKVNLDEVHPSVRREVERRQKIQANRTRTRSYGW